MDRESMETRIQPVKIQQADGVDVTTIRGFKSQNLCDICIRKDECNTVNFLQGIKASSGQNTAVVACPNKYFKYRR